MAFDDITTIDELAKRLPRLLKFQPRNAVVLVGLRGYLLTALTHFPLDMAATAAATQAGVFSRNGIDAAAMFVYGDDVDGAAELATWGALQEHSIRVAATRCFTHQPTGGTDRATVAAAVEHNPAAQADHRARRAIASMETSGRRDHFLAAMLARGAESGRLRALRAAVQVVPDSHPATADLCVCLAIASFVMGDAVITTAATTRALRCAPGHRLAELFAMAYRTGLPPRTIVKMFGGK